MQRQIRSLQLASFVITYRRPHTLASTLARILEQTLRPQVILVVDNGRCPETRAVAEELSGEGVQYEAMSRNLGPAGGAAIGLKRLCEHGYPWIYWAGDDGPPDSQHMLERLVHFGDQIGVENLAAVAASGVQWIWSSGQMRRIPDDELDGPVDVDAIPGGSVLIVRSAAVMKAGWPLPELFWGLEDIEYCLRLRQSGYRLLADGQIMRERRSDAGRLGYSPRRSFIPKVRQDKLPRAYYTVRNYIYLMRFRFGRPDLVRRQVGKTLMACAGSWLRGPRFGAEFCSWHFRAIVDGYRRRMGFTYPIVGEAPRRSAV